MTDREMGYEVGAIFCGARKISPRVMGMGYEVGLTKAHIFILILKHITLYGKNIPMQELFYINLSIIRIIWSRTPLTHSCKHSRESIVV